MNDVVFNIVLAITVPACEVPLLEKFAEEQQTESVEVVKDEIRKRLSMIFPEEELARNE